MVVIGGHRDPMNKQVRLSRMLLISDCLIKIYTVDY